MEKQSVFAGKKIKLLKPYYEIGGIILNETGELKSGDGKVLEFGKDYILAEDDHNDSMTRVYSTNDVLLTEFKIEPFESVPSFAAKIKRQKTARRQMRRLYRKVFDKCLRRQMMRRFRRRKKLGLTFQNEA